METMMEKKLEKSLKEEHSKLRKFCRVHTLLDLVKIGESISFIPNFLYVYKLLK